MRRTLIPLAIAAAIALVSAPAASAAAGWSTPRTVGSAEAGAGDTAASVDGQGLATALWVVKRGDGSFVRAASELSRGAFGSPQTLSTSGESDPRIANVVTDQTGDALVVWCSTIDGVRTVRAATRPAGSQFSAPQTLSSSGVDSCASVSINPSGDAAVAWLSGGRPRFVVSRSFGPLTVEQQVVGAAATGVGDPSVAVDDAGVTRIVWGVVASADGSKLRIAATLRNALGTITPATYISPEYSYALADDQPGGQHGPRVAVDTSGNVAATWIGAGPPSGRKSVQWTASGTTAAGMTSATAITGVVADNDGPGVTNVLALGATAAQGGAGFAESTRHGGSCSSVEAVFSTGAIAAPAGPVGVAGQGTFDPRVASDRAGRLAMGWLRPATQAQDFDGCPSQAGPHVAEATVLGSSAPATLSDPRFPAASLSLGGSQRLTAAWTCFDGRRTRVQVSSFDDQIGKPEWCGSEDLTPPKIKVSSPRYPLRWRSSLRPTLRASCHEQCLATTGLLLFSRGHRAQKLGFVEQSLKPNKRKKLSFPKVGRKGLRAIARAVHRSGNVRLVYRLRFDDLAGNSRLKTVRVRLYP